MIEIIFIEDFADRKKGDVFTCDSMLASQLINIDMVAVVNEVVDVKKSSKTAK